MSSDGGAGGDGRRKKKRAAKTHDAGEQKADYRPLLQLGLHHMRHSVAVFNSKYARQLLTRCVELRSDARTSYAYYVATMLVGRLHEAIEGLGKDAAIDGHAKLKGKAVFLRAIGMARMDQLAKSERACYKAVQIMPEDADVHALRAVVLSLQGKSDECVAAIKEGLEKVPGSVLLHCLLGIEFANRSDLAQAETMFAKARSLDKADANPVFLQALSLEMQGNREGAMKAYNKSITMDPAHLLARVRRGLLLLHEDEVAMAGDDFAEAASIDASCIAALLGRAVATSTMGDYSSATAAARAAFDLLPAPSVASTSSSAKDPYVPLLGFQPAKWMGVGGDSGATGSSSAGTTMDPLGIRPRIKLSELRPDSGWLLLLCAACAEDWEQVKSTSNDLIDADGRSADVLVMRSRANMALGNLSAALRDAGAAVDCDPTDKLAVEQQEFVMDVMVTDP